MMMGVRYIHAVRMTGYKSATSGKNTAKVDNNKATPKENENNSTMYIGRSKAEGRNGTPVMAKIINNGTSDSKKLTMLAKIVETTKDDLGK